MSPRRQMGSAAHIAGQVAAFAAAALRLPPLRRDDALIFSCRAVVAAACRRSQPATASCDFAGRWGRRTPLIAGVSALSRYRR